MAKVEKDARIVYLCGPHDDNPQHVGCMFTIEAQPAADLRAVGNVRMVTGGEPEIRVTSPNHGVAYTYKSQWERDTALRLAQARQDVAHDGVHAPTWAELTDDERETAAIAARNYVRAAVRAGLMQGPRPGAAVSDAAVEAACKLDEHYDLCDFGDSWRDCAECREIRESVAEYLIAAAPLMGTPDE